jgi:hypothetical protein
VCYSYNISSELINKQTPNFAMNTNDIYPTAPQGEKRCTSHVFMTEPELRALLYAGNLLSLSDTPQDPPAILFDLVYAITVLHNFGTESLKDLISTVWSGIIYPGGVMSGRAAAKESRQKHRQEPDRRHESPSRRPDAYDLIMTIPYCLVPPNEVQAILNEAKEREEAEQRSDQRHVMEKVEMWRRGTAV